MRREPIAIELGYKVVDGKIINPKGKEVKGSITKSGFRQFSFPHAETCQTVRVHRLVGYQKFGEAIYDLTMRVRHKDGNKLNNTDDNIEFVKWDGAHYVDEVGQRFGRLVALERHREGDTTYYKCQCDCGTIITTSHSNLKSGAAQSCGCLQKDLVRERSTKPVEDTIACQVWSYYRSNAKNRAREIPWELSKEDVKVLIFSPCFYCGSSGGTLSKTSASHRANSVPREIINNGIDRLDNSLGYTKENSVPCCKDCNSAKWDMTVEEFMAWAQRLVKHLASIDRQSGKGRKLGEPQTVSYRKKAL
jgi:5-methylcytosine-specific restriction endonuclease McrA